MTKEQERLEQALGGKLEARTARVIPGAVAVAGTEFVYFADDGKNAFRKQFRALTEFADPPHASTGGVNERGCKIILPDGQLFHAIAYHGDVNGWRMDIESGAQALHLLLARIEGDKFLVSDGRTFALTDCRIEWS